MKHDVSWPFVLDYIYGLLHLAISKFPEVENILLKIILRGRITEWEEIPSETIGGDSIRISNIEGVND